MRRHSKFLRSKRLRKSNIIRRTKLAFTTHNHSSWVSLGSSVTWSQSTHVSLTKRIISVVQKTIACTQPVYVVHVCSTAAVTCRPRGTPRLLLLLWTLSSRDLTDTPLLLSPPFPCPQRQARTQRGKKHHAADTTKNNVERALKTKKKKKVLFFSLLQDTPFRLLSKAPKQRNLPMMTSPVAVVIMIAPCVYRAHCLLVLLGVCAKVWRQKTRTKFCASPMHIPRLSGAPCARYRRFHSFVGLFGSRRRSPSHTREGGYSRGCRRSAKNHANGYGFSGRSGPLRRSWPRLWINNITLAPARDATCIFSCPTQFFSSAASLVNGWAAHHKE